MKFYPENAFSSQVELGLLKSTIPYGILHYSARVRNQYLTTNPFVTVYNESVASLTRTNVFPHCTMLSFFCFLFILLSDASGRNFSGSG